MVRATASLAICISGAICAQTFDVASIKPSNALPNSAGVKTAHGRLDASNVTLKRLIIGAYGIGPHQVSGGPDWLESDRFDISAKADQQAGDSILMVMLQNLLAERFKLALHRETRTVQALVLEVAKNGPRMEKAEAGESQTNTSGSKTGLRLDGRNTDMDLFVQVLARYMDLPVVNRTELKGIYNFKLNWDTGATEGPSIFTAVQEQLGLKLRAAKAPVEILVIDRAEKPSEN